MRNWRFFLAMCIVVLLTAAISPAVFAQTTDALYFPETNKWVRGEFLRYFRSQRNPSVMIGLPISDEMVDATGVRVQYFERARLEMRMTDKGLVVVPANLGKMLQEDEPNAMRPSSPTCRFFQATRKSVCFDFIKFYDLNDGANQLGNPISEMYQRDNTLMQDFENGRLEFQANVRKGETIRVADLGRIAYQKYVGVIQDNRLNNIPGLSQNHNGIHLHAFVEKSAAAVGEKQTVMVVLHDKDSRAVSGARVNVVLEYASGRKDVQQSGMVDGDGIYRVSFTVGNLPVNQVVRVLVHSEYQEMTLFARTWFRIWY